MVCICTPAVVWSIAVGNENLQTTGKENHDSLMSIHILWEYLWKVPSVSPGNCPCLSSFSIKNQIIVAAMLCSAASLKAQILIFISTTVLNFCSVPKYLFRISKSFASDSMGC